MSTSGPNSPGSVVRVAAIVVVSVIVIAVMRERSTGESEDTAAEAAAAKGDWTSAIVHARAAAEARSPGSPWPERAFRRLDTIGHDAAARGDTPTALLAYGAMRAAAVETRSPWSWFGDPGWQDRADDGIARLGSSPR